VTFYIPHVFSTSDWFSRLDTVRERDRRTDALCQYSLCCVWHQVIYSAVSAASSVSSVKNLFWLWWWYFLFFCVYRLLVLSENCGFCVLYTCTAMKSALLLSQYFVHLPPAPVCDTSCDIILKWINCWVMTWLNDGTLISINIVIVHLGRLVM